MPTDIFSDYVTETAKLGAPGGGPGLLIAESNHRIANNLTLIAGLLRLQANEIARSGQTLGPAQAGMLLSEVGARIETVGQLHRLLATSGDKAGRLDLKVYLGDIAWAVVRSMSGRDVALKPPSGSPCELPAQTALSVGFIVGEAVTNAVKYAHAPGVSGVISVSCERLSEGSILVRVSDDGQGLPQGFDPETEGGLGFKVMRVIAGQLSAKLTFDSADKGLTISLYLPRGRLIPAV